MYFDLHSALCFTCFHILDKYCLLPQIASMFHRASVFFVFFFTYITKHCAVMLQLHL